MEYQNFKLEIVNYDLLGGFVNSYVIETERGIFIIDANTGSSEGLFEKVLSAFPVGIKPVTLLCTHGHWDHVSLAGWLKDRYGAGILAPATSAKLMADPGAQLSALYDSFAPEMPFSSQIRDLYMDEFRYPAEPDAFLSEGDVFSDAGFSLRVVPTPGHWGDCVSFFEENTRTLFCGDAVQAGGLDGNAPFYVNARAYLSSIKTIRSLAPMSLLGGHMLAMGPATCSQLLDLSERMYDEFERFVSELPRGTKPAGAVNGFCARFGFPLTMHAVSVLAAHMAAEGKYDG